MKYKLELIEHVSHVAEKSQMGVMIDKQIINQVENVSKELGWGGKRRIIETALNRFLNELKSEDKN